MRRLFLEVSGKLSDVVFDDAGREAEMCSTTVAASLRPGQRESRTSAVIRTGPRREGIRATGGVARVPTSPSGKAPLVMFSEINHGRTA
jgi:hypothetical protein